MAKIDVKFMKGDQTTAKKMGNVIKPPKKKSDKGTKKK